MKYVLIAIISLFSISALSESHFERAEKARESKNWIVAVSEYEKAFAEGNPVAAHWLGTFYYDGAGVEKSYIHAASYFQIAADEGVSGSMVYLANMLLAGEGVSINCDKAAEWIHKFSEGKVPLVWSSKIDECRATRNKSMQPTPSTTAD